MSEQDDREVQVLWAGDQVLAVFKPPALATQAPPNVDSLEARLRKQLGAQTPYLVFPHRLDRPVSGVILAATSKRAAQLLSAQFESRKIVKSYLALVQGRLPVGPGHWTDTLRKRPDEARVDVVDGADADGRFAETDVDVLGYSAAYHCSVLRMMPTTGRMHQLRVQNAHRGHPILGDALYGWDCEQTPLIAQTFHPLAIALHAESIQFHSPKSGRRLTITAPPDPEWERVAATAGVIVSATGPVG